MILIAEDDKNCREDLTELLEIEGYKVLAVSSGQQAIQAINSQEEFELILCDITMPGITGYGVLIEARGKRPNTPFVFVTAKATPVDEQVGKRMGCDAYIKKPYAIKEMLGVIRHLLRVKREGEAE